MGAKRADDGDSRRRAWMIGGIAAISLLILAPVALSLSVAASLWNDAAERPVAATTIPLTAIGGPSGWRFAYDDADIAIEDAALAAPLGARLEIRVSADDQIRRFALPSFDIAVDAVPGRLTTVYLDADRLGRFESPEAAATVAVLAPAAYRDWIDCAAAGDLSACATGE